MFNDLILRTAAAVEEVTPPSLGEAVDLIESNGIETVLSAVVIVCLMTALGFAVWLGRKRLGGNYIKKDEAIAYVKKEHSDMIVKQVNELPDLRQHDAFDMFDQVLRSSYILRILDKDGNVDEARTNIAKDLIQWHMRGYRNVFKHILDEAYQLVEKDPNTFEEYFGDSKSFHHMINQSFTNIKAGVMNKLRNELQMPKFIYDTFDEMRQEINETMRDMLQIAVSNHSNNYWRMHEVLNSQYAFSRVFKTGVVNFIDKMGDKLDGVNYESGSGSYMTAAAFTAPKFTTPNAGPDIFNL